jgi:glycosyltransferase involved in cell wall biosynthesis
MKPLHVAIDARVLGERGVGRYLSSLLAALAKIKGPQRYSLFVNSKSRPELAPSDPRFEIVNLGAVNPALAEQRGIPRLARARGAGLLHYPDNTGALFPGLPMVLTMHDGMWRRPLGEAILRPSPRQRLQDAYRKFVCPRAARRAAAVITVSRFSARELALGLGLGPTLHVVPNALGPGFERPLPAAALKRELAGLGLSGPFFFCSGAADRRKNISRLIRAFAASKLKNMRLVVSSLRPGEQASTDYAAVAEACGVAERVSFLGFVTETQLKALYQGASAYVFPSLWEGFGLPMLEAYALGCPVLASNAGALPEVGGDAAIYADPEDEAALAEGLRKVLKAGRAQFKRRAQRELKRYSWDRSAAQTLALYYQAAAS